jgi:hypothetical protein
LHHGQCLPTQARCATAAIAWPHWRSFAAWPGAQAHGLAAVERGGAGQRAAGGRGGVGDSGEIWIVEIKSCLEDFRADQKWPEYRAFCDRLFFAVAPGFPREVLPEDAGPHRRRPLWRRDPAPAPEHKLAGARRKAMTLRLLRAAAFRLQRVIDPERDIEALPRL